MRKYQGILFAALFVLQCFCFWRQGSGGTVHDGRTGTGARV